MKLLKKPIWIADCGYTYEAFYHVVHEECANQYDLQAMCEFCGIDISTNDQEPIGCLSLGHPAIEDYLIERLVDESGVSIEMLETMPKEKHDYIAEWWMPDFIKDYREMV